MKLVSSKFKTSKKKFTQCKTHRHQMLRKLTIKPDSNKDWTYSRKKGTSVAIQHGS